MLFPQWRMLDRPYIDCCIWAEDICDLVIELNFVDVAAAIEN